MQLLVPHAPIPLSLSLPAVVSGNVHAARIVVNRAGAKVELSLGCPPPTMDEKIELLIFRGITARLKSTDPGTIVRSYFEERRELGFVGRRVTHISRTCPELWQVRACIYSPPFVFFSKLDFAGRKTFACLSGLFPYYPT